MPHSKWSEIDHGVSPEALAEARRELGFLHPETGELLEAQDEFRAALDDINERMQPLWRVQRAIREAYADRFPAAAMPERRRRTDKQEAVARCPRCGTVPVVGDESE